MLLIKNGRVIDPARKKERNADIVVKDGKLKNICRRNITCRGRSSCQSGA